MQKGLQKIIKSPKIYWRDTGLLHSLLNINSIDDLYVQPWVGNSWEGWIIEQIIINLNNEAINFDGPYFFRTSDGAEIDLVINIAGAIWAIEIKLSSSPGRHDIERLKKASAMIDAEYNVLISRTKNTVKEGNIFI